MSYTNDTGRELGWDETIDVEPGFTLLEPGTYEFKVVNLERGRHTPRQGGTLPACNKATVHCEIMTDAGEAVVIKNNLFLHTRTQGLLAVFFAAIGQKKKGEPLRMNWNKVIGSTGLCEVGQYPGNDGNTYNEIKKFLLPDDYDEPASSGSGQSSWGGGRY